VIWLFGNLCCLGEMVEMQTSQISLKKLCFVSVTVSRKRLGLTYGESISQRRDFSSYMKKCGFWGVV
jgi:hypothetical protein